MIATGLERAVASYGAYVIEALPCCVWSPILGGIATFQYVYLLPFHIHLVIQSV